jgi:hypothetical protein
MQQQAKRKRSTSAERKKALPAPVVQKRKTSAGKSKRVKKRRQPGQGTYVE